MINYNRLKINSDHYMVSFTREIINVIIKIQSRYAYSVPRSFASLLE